MSTHNEEELFIISCSYQGNGQLICNKFMDEGHISVNMILSLCVTPNCVYFPDAFYRSIGVFCQEINSLKFEMESATIYSLILVYLKVMMKNSAIMLERSTQFFFKYINI